MIGSNVLRVNQAEEQTAYRDAVAEILRRVQSDHTVTLLEISERIDVSLGTISNAANKKNDLNPIYLKRIGNAYGPESLNPYLALMGGRAIPLERRDVRDILPFMARANLKIVTARDPESPGGTREVHTERLDYLPELLALQREISSLICEIREAA